VTTVTLLPTALERLILPNGTINPVWHRFFQQFIANKKDVKALEDAVTPVTEFIDQAGLVWGVTVNVDGNVTGAVRLDGDISQSTFSVLADRFEIVNPNNAGDTITAFVVQLVGGVPTVGINGNLVLPGTIEAESLNATNVGAINGIFGVMKTNLTTTRVEINSDTNDLVAYVSGNVIARIGASNSNGRVELYSADSAFYPFYSKNTSTTGGDLSTGGGAGYCESFGGYAFQAVTTTTGNSVAINAANTGTGGGQGQVGRSAGAGGHAFYSLGGGYGPFTGAHDALIPKSDMSPEPGDIMIDGAIYGKQLSDVLTEVSRSSAPNQPGALGAFARRYPILDQSEPPPSMWSGTMDEDELFAWWDLIPTHDLAVVNSVGEGCINVCGEGGDISVGDLIVTSSVPGKGMRQADDFVRSITVARAREAVSFDGTEVRQIACIYLSG